MFKWLDGAHRHSGDPHNGETCPFSEGCKRHYSPGDILRYSIAIILSIFLLFLVISMFFPNIVQPPNISILHDLINIIHHAIGGEVVGKSAS